MAVTLVPERREEVTTEGGLALNGGTLSGRVRDAVAALREAGIRTSLFIDPDPAAIDAAANARADAVELHTGAWAEHWKRRNDGGAADALLLEISRLRRAAAHGSALGLALHAGHGLTYENVAQVAAIEDIEELNIGHSVVSRAILVGMQQAVAEMKQAVRRARRGGRS
jgi:pyridoxine 5-phosphate synthase